MKFCRIKWILLHSRPVLEAMEFKNSQIDFRMAFACWREPRELSLSVWCCLHREAGTKEENDGGGDGCLDFFLKF